MADSKKYTYEDYCALDDDSSYELCEGELQMVPSPVTRHQRMLRELGFALLKYVKEKNAGEIFYAPYDVVLGEDTVLQPDLVFVSKSHISIIAEKNIQGIPDLVIEILSESSGYRDLVPKKRIYARFGVKEYWIVDPLEKTVDVMALKGKKFELCQQFISGETLNSPLFPDLGLPLAELFAMI